MLNRTSGFAIMNSGTIPMFGDANFDGYASLKTSDGTHDLMGDLNLTVSFLNNRSSGQITQIVDANNAAVTGSLSLGQGGLNRTATPNITSHTLGTLTGSLAQGGDQMVVNGFYAIDLRGASAQAIGGTVSGTIATNGAPPVGFNGTAIGELQP